MPPPGLQTKYFGNSFEQSLAEAIQAHVKIEVEKAIEDAKCKLDFEIPKIVAAIGLTVQSNVNVQDMGRDLHLTIVVKKPDLATPQGR